MASHELHKVLQIRQMAIDAAKEPESGYAPASACYELAQAYIRLREQARKLNEGAGWPTEPFDEAVPPADFGDLPAPGTPAFEADSASYELVSVVGPRVRIMLRQLAGWADGKVKIFEIEDRLKAEAAAKAEAGAQGKGKLGFVTDEN